MTKKERAKISALADGMGCVRSICDAKENSEFRVEHASERLFEFAKAMKVYFEAEKREEEEEKAIMLKELDNILE